MSCPNPTGGKTAAFSSSPIEANEVDGQRNIVGWAPPTADQVDIAGSRFLCSSSTPHGWHGEPQCASARGILDAPRLAVQAGATMRPRETQGWNVERVRTLRTVRPHHAHAGVDHPPRPPRQTSTTRGVLIFDHSSRAAPTRGHWRKRRTCAQRRSRTGKWARWSYITWRKACRRLEKKYRGGSRPLCETQGKGAER